MNGQIGFQFRQDRCIGCLTCQVACKEKNNLPPGQLFRKVREYSGGDYTQCGKGLDNTVYAYWQSTACKHCRQPLCAQICPAEAILKRPEDGIVLIDQEKCTGCHQCMRVCPEGAPQYDPELRKAGKCDLCHELLAGGKPPACVAACPMRALVITWEGHAKIS